MYGLVLARKNSWSGTSTSHVRFWFSHLTHVIYKCRKNRINILSFFVVVVLNIGAWNSCEYLTKAQKHSISFWIRTFCIRRKMRCESSQWCILKMSNDTNSMQAILTGASSSKATFWAYDDTISESVDEHQSYIASSMQRKSFNCFCARTKL